MIPQTDKPTLYNGHSTPAWLADGPLIITGSWDNTPIFRRRKGGNPHAADLNYARRYTKETAAKIKDYGVTLAIIDYYKAFGLKAELEYLQDAAPFVEACREYGIKIGVYVGSTIGFETFLLERPDAIGWFVHIAGDRLFYPSQSFRNRFYFMHPGFLEYLKEVLRYAIVEFGADEIHFDSYSQLAAPEIFFHPLAIEHFRDYLRTKYTPETLKLRIGFSDPSYVLPPQSGGAPGGQMFTVQVADPQFVDDPVFQEWTDFRCHQLAAFFREMSGFIRGLNPQVAVSINPAAGMSGRNMAWEGVDYARLLPHTDIMWTEEPSVAGVTSLGVLVSKIRTFKMASSMGVRTLSYTGGTNILSLAESMAYNLQSLGMLGDPLDTLPSDQAAYARFFIDNFDLFRDTTNIADIAVLHSYSTMTFTSETPWSSSLLLQQLLIQEQKLFDIIFDSGLEELSKYRVLMLPDQESLGSRQCDLIRTFVQGGGALIATEHTSLYDEWRRRLADFNLQDLFGLHWPSGMSDSEATLNIPPIQSVVGKGRVVYLPAVVPAIDQRALSSLPDGPQWAPPANARDILRLLRWAAPGGLTLEMDCSDTVTVELQEQRGTGNRMLHMLNYNYKVYPELPAIPVSVVPPKNLKEVVWYSPDEKSSQPLPFTSDGNRIAFTLPRLRTYSIVLMRSA